MSKFCSVTLEKLCAGMLRNVFEELAMDDVADKLMSFKSGMDLQFK